MSQGLLYHGLGVGGYRWEAETFSGGQWRIGISPEPGSLRCSQCASRDVIRRGQEVREFRALPLGSKATKLVLGVPRVECRSCGCLRQVAVNFAPPRCRYTHGFACYALELCKLMTIKDVARHLGVGWDLIKDLQKNHLRKHYAKPRLKHLRRIAIDEIAVAKGHVYKTASSAPQAHRRSGHRLVLVRRAGDEQPSVHNGRMAHEWVSQPFLPDDLSRPRSADHHGAALSVERNKPPLHHGDRGTIVGDLQLPDDLARQSVESVEVIGPITSGEVLGQMGDLERKPRAVAPPLKAALPSDDIIPPTSRQAYFIYSQT